MNSTGKTRIYGAVLSLSCDWSLNIYDRNVSKPSKIFYCHKTIFLGTMVLFITQGNTILVADV